MKIVQWLVSIICIATCFGDTKPISDKPIAVVICSFNNRNFYQKNLQSVLDQAYSNYRIIYVDDCSSDGTADAVEEFVNNHPNKHKFHLIRNTSRRKAMANLWHAIHTCDNDEIVLTLDGDDWLPHNNTLNIVASYYDDPDVWVAYSNHIRHPDGKPGISRPWNQSRINSVGVRKHPYIVSHLRSFYAGLFKQVRLQDLTIESDFVPTTYDLAMFFPMLEMAEGHIKFMKEKLYIYNCVNPISDQKAHRPMQAKIDKYTRQLKPYHPLNFNPTQKNDSLEEQKVDLVVFSYNRPTQLYAFLESLYKLTKHSNHVHVIYRSDNEEYEKGYEIVRNTFPDVIWKRQKNPPHDFKPLTIQSAFSERSQAKYIAFAVDDIIIKDELDFLDATRLMNKTKGYAFLLRLGKEINNNFMTRKYDAMPHYMQIDPDAMAWQVSQVSKTNCWGYVNNVDMTIYRKQDIHPYFAGQSAFTNPNYLEGRWQGHCDRGNIVLCYNTAKIVNIPMNVVSTFQNRHCHSYSPKQLLEKLFDGYKLNIDAVYQQKYSAVHVNTDPGFVKK